jgi:multiple sugar transport system permease protein
MGFAMAVSAETPVTSSPSPRRFSQRRLREILTAYAFLAPATIAIFFFGIFPLGYAFYMSLYEWRLRQGDFIGFENYIEALGEPTTIFAVLGGIVLLLVAWVVWDKGTDTPPQRRALHIGAVMILAVGVSVLWFGLPLMLEQGDDDLFSAILVTAWYSIGTVPIQIGLSLVLASILYQNIKGKGIYRMLFFLPYITPSVAAAAVFRVMFISRPEGVINRFIGIFGVEPQRWLQEPSGIFELMTGQELPQLLAGPSLALMVIIIFNIWTFVGFNTVVYLAGLGQIPKDLYEAAEVDGADRWASFRNITIPLLSPTTFFLTMLGVIGTFKAFSHVYVMQLPGARETTTTASIFIFNEFYKSSQFSYAAAMAFILFGIILLLTFVQNRIMGRRVFYG